MNIYIIQPDFKTVAQVEVGNELGLDKIYKLLSTDIKNVNCIDAVRDYSNPDNTDVIYIDDEGLLIDENYAFSFNDNAYFGRGIVVGTDNEGKNTSPIMPIEYYMQSIRLPKGPLKTEEYQQPPMFIPMD
jgi:hypothetical protein|tara:strand:+ start:70 stop:459 length:390 start_codon:yes stop_codon:yes gene_type:complete